MNTILVIEDTHEVRENIAEILELDDYSVLQAANGKEGVSLAIEHTPDLILCDVMMPELDGFGVLKILNKNQKTHHIPFIFLTAKAEKADFRKGMGLGADDYITKPFDDTDLLEAIEMRLKKSSLIQKSFDQTESGLQQFFSQARGEEALKSITEKREVRYFNKKDVIYREGQNPRWLFFIVSGRVKQVRTNELGKDLLINIYNPGEFFGYQSLITQLPYANTTVALEESTIRLIPESDFKTLLFNNRDFAAQFIRMIANSASETEQQLIELAYSSVRRKVAITLLSFVNQTNDNLIKASREDLASKAGIAKETFIRTLSEFKSEELIRISGSEIEILDKTKLENMPY